MSDVDDWANERRKTSTESGESFIDELPTLAEQAIKMRNEIVEILREAGAIEEGELIVEAVRRLAQQGMGDLPSVECPNCKDWPTGRHLGDGLDCKRCNNTKKVLAMEVG